MRRLHTYALAFSALLGLFVGGWAYFAPQSFYDSFPGVLGSWVSVDGPYNEHLIRDVGAMYLALAAASIGGLIWRSTIVFRVLGLAWSVFGALHFAYHAGHSRTCRPRRRPVRWSRSGSAWRSGSCC